jgi:hypothetical protein
MLSYIKIGILVAVLAIGAGAAWWVQGVRLDKKNTEISNLKKEVIAYKRVKEIYENDMELDQELKDQEERVKKLTPDQLNAEYDKLRSYGSGKPNKNNNP